MTEGMEEVSAGPAPPFGSVSPTGSTVDTRQVPEEKPEETEAAGESGEEAIEGTAEGGGAGNDGEHVGAFGIVTLPEACCVCIEMEQINNCLHSEKICILPILACLLSLALCTAGLKWVFVDKIFEYEPPSHLDPKPIGQDPIIIPVEPTLGITVSFPHATPSNNSLTTTFTLTPEHPEVSVEDKSTQQPHVSQSSRVIEPAVTLKYNAEHYTTPKQTPQRKSTQKSHSHHQTISTISTSTTAKTSSHVTRCSDSQRNYCVNGGECFTLEIIPGSTKFLCRCLAGFTGHRCEQAVLKNVSDPKQAEELYQKRILTITGICIALLVVGIMCVVAYCKTKKQRKKLRDRLRQRLRNKRKNTSTGIDSNVANSTTGRPNSNLPLQDLQLIGQHNGKTMKHTAEKETETNLSTSKYTLSVHNPTTLTNISSQRFVPVMATSESQNSLATPGSPPSEISAPISSLAISVPSVTLSPSGEEERPLLHQLHKSSSRDVQKRTSSHYNHGHVADSLPSSPLFAMENTDYQTIQDTRAASYMFSIAPVKLINTNNNVSDCSNNSVTDHVVDYLRLNGDSILVSDTEEPRGEHIPFLSADRNTVLLLRAVDSGRTNPASPNDDLPVKSSSLINQQDLIAA
ncbi:pro-neuregulin-1, membrane-bound isoform isoform X1 [Maylandia zebra]|uniref:pro-neuregulin-1, membrane-bound isoform isoform X1 n=1 Tax=Maylandia zebra TaxID=106582 RepID=UPI00032977F5|nr:pro-neuregulin-1, membrane-bound isoform isoform X1 [Maylandia zebra]XP_004564742.1 pro-neuregulin-1, membrane-bound isoform isoform X1 [Maylandia zebra]XP_026028658.1 pro-neuregulin-1, membrane-bound isoform-like isoform X1 [Astatotilapia calliptera]XP_026028659.1 pro-neuregulin-1, membrane-bound isoform-like isoform X1 [Astatotilapia calliptera]